MLQEPLLQFSDFSIDFNTGNGSISAVRHVTLSVAAGSITGIVGESGSGKSTTCLSILRLLKGNAILKGRIAFGEHDNLLNLSEASLRRLAGKEIAYIFQEPMTALNPVQRCGKQLLENIKLHSGIKGKEARQHAMTLLSEVQLPDIERIFNAYPHEISGGQRQRVMIAMAIAGNPRLLIADEPTTALDKVVQKDILDLLLKLNRERNMAIILISHDFDVISAYASNVIIMYKGEIVEQGQTQQVLRQPQHPYTKALLACKPGPQHKKVFLPTLADFSNDAEPPLRHWPVQEKSSAVLIAAENISKTYRSGHGYVAAVEQVSFTINKGETLGLIGESGSGKSTISKLLIRLEGPTKGSILFDGRVVDTIKTYPAVAQMVFQDPYSSLNPELCIGTALGEVVALHQKKFGRDNKSEVANLLLKVGLNPEDAGKYPNEFSGGQRQRICIARALAVKPEFIICDESVSALDLSVQAQILNLLKQLQISEKLTYLFITHDMNVVRYFADRIVVLKHGRIVESGDTEALSTAPASDYTRSLLS